MAYRLGGGRSIRLSYEGRATTLLAPLVPSDRSVADSPPASARPIGPFDPCRTAWCVGRVRLEMPAADADFIVESPRGIAGDRGVARHLALAG